jgi:hypothetical protein
VAERAIGPGSVLAGRFRLEDLLDDTDGARFWRATDLTLARNVAVHVISADDRRAAALLAAARTSATVSDGHLLRVLDAAAEEGVVYVVNEWASGMSLDRMLEEGPLSPRRAAWVVREVSEAISTAHRHGVAHGRLLPENVMVTEAGSVKLIGFVIDAVLNGRESIRITGGPALGEHEADVVNLAALLYAALVGRWPGTEGSSLPPAPTEHGHALRPRQVRAGIPRPLDAICERVLNPHPHGHALPIETAHEIYAALSDYIGDPAAFAGVGHESTILLDDATRATALVDSGPPTQLHPGPSGAKDPRDVPADDPDSTQAGVPVFYDEDSGVGWTEGGHRREPGSEEPSGRRTPPPPVLPEPEPKPLFAPGPPRAPLSPAPERDRASTPTPSRAAREAGPRNGSLPPTWGPDAGRGSNDSHTGELAGTDPGHHRRGGGWLRIAAAIAGVVVLVAAVVLAFNLGRGSDTPETPSAQQSQTPSRAPSKVLDIANVSDFDPEGDPSDENPDLVPLATDANPSTAWQTLTYSRPDLGGLKSGVGLLLDLGAAKQVSRVDVTLIGAPTSVQLLAAAKGAARPTGTAGLDTVASQEDAGTQVRLRLDKPVTSRYLVVWLTSLPPGAGGYKGQVAEVSVRS